MVSTTLQHFWWVVSLTIARLGMSTLLLLKSQCYSNRKSRFGFMSINNHRDIFQHYVKFSSARFQQCGKTIQSQILKNCHYTWKSLGILGYISSKTFHYHPNQRVTKGLLTHLRSTALEMFPWHLGPMLNKNVPSYNNRSETCTSKMIVYTLQNENGTQWWRFRNLEDCFPFQGVDFLGPSR